MPEQSILDARLAEIDRRLSLIQSGLAPSVERWAAEEAQASADLQREPETAPRPPAPRPPAPASPASASEQLAEV
ncbi:MAG TPA: hypothetical protein VE127_06540, partial [Solirubrobacteraceae bacterium]|nr:hypothetical protein [Solirubrobacteraceae bacterium]